MNDVASIVSGWTARADAERVLERDREASIAEVAGWIALALSARDDTSATNELLKLVALHGRMAGAEGRSASALALRMGALDEAWKAAASDSYRSVSGVLRTMTRVALDAHGLGAAEARDARHHRAIRDMTPVFRAGVGRVVLILIGPMIPELIDSAMARLLNTCAAEEASTAVIDVLGAAPDDARFHETVAALLRDPAGYKLSLVLTGLADPDRTRAGLTAAGAEMARIKLVPQLSDVLS